MPLQSAVRGAGFLRQPGTAVTGGEDLQQFAGGGGSDQLQRLQGTPLAKMQGGLRGVEPAQDLFNATACFEGKLRGQGRAERVRGGIADSRQFRGCDPPGVKVVAAEVPDKLSCTLTDGGVGYR